jgi:hypothetical protein
MARTVRELMGGKEGREGKGREGRADPETGRVNKSVHGMPWHSTVQGAYSCLLKGALNFASLHCNNLGSGSVEGLGISRQQLRMEASEA